MGNPFCSFEGRTLPVQFGLTLTVGGSEIGESTGSLGTTEEDSSKRDEKDKQISF